MATSPPDDFAKLKHGQMIPRIPLSTEIFAVLAGA